MTRKKLSELPVNTVIESKMEGNGGYYMRDVTALGEAYWIALFYHCIDCSDDTNLTLEQADRDITDYQIISLPYGVAVHMGIALQDEYGFTDSEGEEITVRGLINDAIDAYDESEARQAAKESGERYPKEDLGDDDDGTMVESVKSLTEQVVGRKIVAVERGVSHETNETYSYGSKVVGTALVLDDGTRVLLVDTDDCCAYTALEDVVMNLDKIDHVIMGVGTTDGYTKWHIYADFGDVVELKVGWSCGNPFYYGYGFDIYVIPENA